MTRYARSGNTQKHKKMPGDSTPWKELSQKTGNSNETAKFNKTKKSRFNKTKVKKENSQDVLEINPSDREIKTKPVPEENLIKNEPILNISHSSDQLEEVSVVTNAPSQSPIEPSTDKTVIVEDAIHSETEADEGNQFMESKDEESSKKSKLDKKAINRKRYEMERAKKGIILLKPSMEKKLYNLRRTLTKKGLSAEAIKEILRKERRKAELSFRKMMHKTCFNCRQTGHILADCPSKRSNTGSETVNQQTGLCFKCGSTEHTSSKCSKRVDGYPFASCFVCKGKGHISRDCPQNEHGIYIKGGKCTLCGNVNHLRKDCPTLKKQKISEETDVSGHLIGKGESVDAEIVEEKLTPRNTEKTKKLKIVKF